MNRSLRPQRTLADIAKFSGFGYWSGQDVHVELHPAAENTGVVFVRTDLSPPLRIPVAVENRIEMPRRTTLAVKGGRVEMVEHILAALAGLGVDNCEVHVDRPEMPGLDGSSQAVVDAILSVGIQQQRALRSRLTIEEVTRVGDENSWVEARPSKTGGFQIKVRLDYSGTIIGRQTVQLEVNSQSFTRELASARTFIFEKEAQWLKSQGLCKRASTSDLLVFGEEGPIDNELRFADECVRHKALDLVGDLALSGCELVGHFVAHCSGHKLNADLVRAVLAEGRLESESLRRSA